MKKSSRKRRNKKRPVSRLNAAPEGLLQSEVASPFYGDLAAGEPAQGAGALEAGVRGLNIADGQSAAAGAMNYFHDLPFPVMKKIANGLNSRDIMSLMDASPVWGESILYGGLLKGLVIYPPSGAISLQDLFTYMYLCELGAAAPKMPKLGDPEEKDPYRRALKLNSSEELRKFASMAKKGDFFRAGVTGERKTAMDFLGQNPQIVLDNDKEYEKSSNPHDIFRDVCKSCEVIRASILDSMAARFDLGSDEGKLKAKKMLAVFDLSSAYFLPEICGNAQHPFLSGARVQSLVIPCSDETMSLRGRNLSTRIARVENIITTAMTVDVKMEGAEDSAAILKKASAKAQDCLRFVLDIVDNLQTQAIESIHPSLVIDPTVLYCDNSSGAKKFVDLDPKREGLIPVVRDSVVGSDRYAVRDVRILPPRGPQDVPMSDGGLSANPEVAVAPLPNECVKRWSDLKRSLEARRSDYRCALGYKVVFDEGFPPRLRGEVKFPPLPDEVQRQLREAGVVMR